MRLSFAALAFEKGRSNMPSFGRFLITTLLLAHTLVSALDLNIDDIESVKSASYTLANKIMRLYPGNTTGIPGLFGAPYYWWEAGAAFGGFVDYWHLTKDTSFNPTVTQALLFQVGPDNNYEPPNQTQSLGNDDQSFWGIAALSAAEKLYPNPPANQPQWLALAQAVFNRQAFRWEAAYCDGGMRWQIVQFNKGYSYKNSVSNGLFFHMGARLARFTGNDTYAQYAEKTWDWLAQVGYLHISDYRVFDGADISTNCTGIDRTQWSYNSGILLGGAAVMYNYTNGSDKWKQRVDGLLAGAIRDFFQGDVMFEVACERVDNCDGDQRSFKAYLSRFLALTMQMAPYTIPQIQPKLRASAIAAAKICDGDLYGTNLYCGMRWTQSTNDNSAGPQGQILGQHLSALEVVQNNLIYYASPPLTLNTGATSKGNPNAGMNGQSYDNVKDLSQHPIKTGGKLGAAFLTILVTGLFSGMAWFMVTDVLG